MCKKVVVSLIEIPITKWIGSIVKEKKKYKSGSEGCSFHVAVNLWSNLGHDRTGLGSGRCGFRDDSANFRNGGLRGGGFERSVDDFGRGGSFRLGTGRWRSLRRHLGGG